jgi:hypothetical protein
MADGGGRLAGYDDEADKARALWQTMKETAGEMVPELAAGILEAFVKALLTLKIDAASDEARQGAEAMQRRIVDLASKMARNCREQAERGDVPGEC